MKVKLVAFGIARDIIKSSQVDFTLESGSTIGVLKNELTTQYPDFDALRSLRFAVHEDYQDDDFQLSDKDEVVIIPPVSGG